MKARLTLQVLSRSRQELVSHPLLLLNWSFQTGDHVQRTVRPRTDAFKYKQRIFFLSVIKPWTYRDCNRV